jgi:geranylgeranyl pyrophosphate synthase
MTVVTERFDLQAYLETEWNAVEAARKALGEDLLPGLAPAIAEPIRYALDAGGKRLRPILCVAAYRAVSRSAGNGDSPATSETGIYEIAVAVEFIHTYSLIHDDLPSMDDDDLRRGQPTTHRVYGVPRAVVAGAALIPLSSLVLDRGGRSLGLTAAERAGLVRELSTAAGAGGMVGGQWSDLEAEGRALDLAQLEGIHHQKTGALLASAARLGGLAARADAGALNALATYGRALGLAFQIADDILDLTGDSKVLGKTAGRDLDLGKATYPSLLGVEAARDRASAEADRAIAALRGGGLATVELEALARHAVERNH